MTFIRDCEPDRPIEKIWEAVQEVSESHPSNGFADPTAGGVVADAMNAVSQIERPRSWPKEHEAAFLALPYPLQVYVRNQDNFTRR